MPVNPRKATGPLSAIEQQRWMPVLNESSTTAPPGAAMEIVRVDSEGVFRVRRPTENNLRCERVVINSMSELPAGRFGLGSLDFPAVARITGSPDLKDAIGTVANQWHMASGKHFILLSQVDDSVGMVGACPDRSGEGACRPPLYIPCCPDVPMPAEATLTIIMPDSPMLDGLVVELRGHPSGYSNYYHSTKGLPLGQCTPSSVGIPLWYWLGVRVLCTPCTLDGPLTWNVEIIAYQWDFNNVLGATDLARLTSSPSVFSDFPPVCLNVESGIAATVQCDPFLIASEEPAYWRHVGYGAIPPWPDDRGCTGAWVAATVPMDFIIA